MPAWRRTSGHLPRSAGSANGASTAVASSQRQKFRLTGSNASRSARPATQLPDQSRLHSASSMNAWSRVACMRADYTSVPWRNRRRCWWSAPAKRPAARSRGASRARATRPASRGARPTSSRRWSSRSSARAAGRAPSAATRAARSRSWNWCRPSSARSGRSRSCVFNVGGNVRFPIRETTARVYTKVWEMAALAGFLVGREAAKVMVPRRPRHDPLHRRHRQPARRQGLRRLRRRQARAARARAEHGARTRARGHPRRARGGRRRDRHALHPRQLSPSATS